MIRVERDEKQIAVITMDLPGRSANLLGKELFDDLSKCVAQLAAKPPAGVVLTSAKNDFMAGADLQMLLNLTNPADAFEMSMNFKACVRKLECLGVPVVAAINGTALGGGMELTLIAHHRIALNKKGVRLGFPEVKLGLFPGGGGATRLPRMIGIQKALPILLEGKDFAPQQALENGLIDALAETPEDLMFQAKDWILTHPRSNQPWDCKDFKWPGGSPKGGAIMQLMSVAPSMLNQKTRGNYPNQQWALASVYEGSQVDFDTADRIESRYFAKAVTDRTAKNMITAFWFQMNEIKRGGSRPQNAASSTIKKVGVLGAGMMGSGIAWSCALSGLEVVLKDVSQEQAEKGKAYSQKLLEKRMSRGRSTPEKAQAVLDRIKPTCKAEDLSGCDLIVEAVFEDRELKAEVTRESEAAMDPGGVFASNTSTLPITGLAKASSRPQQFIGLHFFSPVDKMQLVEIIVGEQTSKEALATAFDFVLAIRKTPIVVNDSRGFYTSRVFSTYVREGMALLQEGMAPRAIESAGLQAGMPVGPLALSDEVSLSLMHHINTQTVKDLEAMGQTASSHPADRVIAHFVQELNRPGKKAGRGFYDYPPEGKKHLWSGLTDIYTPAANQLPQDKMMERMMFVQALETIRCLEEGVLTSVADANIGSILGWGFAPFKGGTLQYVNDYGLAAFTARTKQLEAEYGVRFTPPQLLLDMVKANSQFGAVHDP